jgi:dolichol-phosphate mannosyltransferase
VWAESNRLAGDGSPYLGRGPGWLPGETAFECTARMNESSPMPVYSVVVPFYNEADSLQSLLAEIRAAMDAVGEPWEAIFVNDGSRDATESTLREATTDWSDCHVITLPRNRGQAAALWTGFQAARGAWIITLDGDGQNVPADIARLLPLRHGHDMVVGVRVTRRDSWLRRAMSRVANAVRGRFLRDGLTDSGCALKVFRREVVASFLPMRSLYSFMPAFAVAAGFTVTEIPVQHRERQGGKSNYGFGVFAWRPLADMLAIGWVSRRRF